MNTKKLKEQFREQYLDLAYSPANMAYLVLWPAGKPVSTQQVLAILPTKQDCQAFLRELDYSNS